tara:strand:- start:890 stop:2131 length:1242 start_codon:yes stop_codon:yes gene_type:complete
MAVTKTISRDGETRAIKITGKAGSTFEFYIKQGSNYYNFDSNSFTSSIFILKKQEIPANGNYVKKVVIPAVTSNTKYDFFITPTGSSKLNIKTTDDLKVGTLYQKGAVTLTVTTTDDTTLNIASSLTGGTATEAGATINQSGAITEASGNLVYVHEIPKWTPQTGGAWTNSRKVLGTVLHGRKTIYTLEDATNVVTGLTVTNPEIIDEITVSAVSGNTITLSSATPLNPGDILTFTPSQWEFSAIGSKVNSTHSGTTSVTFSQDVTVAKVGTANLTVELDVDDFISIKPNAFPVNVNCPVGTTIEVDCKAECTNFLGTLGDLDRNTKTFKVQSIPAHATSSAAIRTADTSIIGTISKAADEAFGSAGNGVIEYTPHASMIPGDTDVFFYKTVDAQSSPQTSSLTQGKVTITIV